MNRDESGFQLHDILLLLAVQRRTGELVLESGNNIGTLLFHEGHILQAFSPYSRAIGDLLVEDGVLTETELLEALRVQKQNSPVLIGALLIQTGKVSFALVESMVQEQIRNSIADFIGWTPLNYSFVNKDITPPDSIHLPVYEFIPRDTLVSSLLFLTTLSSSMPVAPPPGTSAALS